MDKLIDAQTKFSIAVAGTRDIFWFNGVFYPDDTLGGDFYCFKDEVKGKIWISKSKVIWIEGRNDGKPNM